MKRRKRFNYSSPREQVLLLFLFLPALASSSPLPSPDPSPQLVVRSQSLLYGPKQHGRQIDLTGVLPTSEVFWLNYEEGYFACQVNASEKYVRLFRISRLCDGFDDCFEGSDELVEQLKCAPSGACDPPCARGACLLSRKDDLSTARCHCDDGFGGASCAHPDVNECRFRPCSVFADCTNTVGSFRCQCREGYEGDGFKCERKPEAEDAKDGDSENVIIGGGGEGEDGDEGSVESVISNVRDIVGNATKNQKPPPPTPPTETSTALAHSDDQSIASEPSQEGKEDDDDDGGVVQIDVPQIKFNDTGTLGIVDKVKDIIKGLSGEEEEEEHSSGQQAGGGGKVDPAADDDNTFGIGSSAIIGDVVDSDRPATPPRATPSASSFPAEGRIDPSSSPPDDLNAIASSTTTAAGPMSDGAQDPTTTTQTVILGEDDSSYPSTPKDSAAADSDKLEDGLASSGSNAMQSTTTESSSSGIGLPTEVTPDGIYGTASSHFEFGLTEPPEITANATGGSEEKPSDKPTVTTDNADQAIPVATTIASTTLPEVTATTSQLTTTDLTTKRPTVSKGELVPPVPSGRSTTQRPVTPYFTTPTLPSASSATYFTTETTTASAPASETSTNVISSTEGRRPGSSPKEETTVPSFIPEATETSSVPTTSSVSFFPTSESSVKISSTSSTSKSEPTIGTSLADETSSKPPTETDSNASPGSEDFNVNQVEAASPPPPSSLDAEPAATTQSTAAVDKEVSFAPPSRPSSGVDDSGSKETTPSSADQQPDGDEGPTSRPAFREEISKATSDAGDDISQPGDGAANNDRASDAPDESVVGVSNTSGSSDKGESATATTPLATSKPSGTVSDDEEHESDDELLSSTARSVTSTTAAAGFEDQPEDGDEGVPGINYPKESRPFEATSPPAIASTSFSSRTTERSNTASPTPAVTESSSSKTATTTVRSPTVLSSRPPVTATPVSTPGEDGPGRKSDGQTDGLTPGSATTSATTSATAAESSSSTSDSTSSSHAGIEANGPVTTLAPSETSIASERPFQPSEDTDGKDTSTTDSSSGIAIKSGDSHEKYEPKDGISDLLTTPTPTSDNVEVVGIDSASSSPPTTTTADKTRPGSTTERTTSSTGTRPDFSNEIEGSSETRDTTTMATTLAIQTESSGDLDTTSLSPVLSSTTESVTSPITTMTTKSTSPLPGATTASSTDFIASSTAATSPVTSLPIDSPPATSAEKELTSASPATMSDESGGGMGTTVAIGSETMAPTATAATDETSTESAPFAPSTPPSSAADAEAGDRDDAANEVPGAAAQDGEREPPGDGAIKYNNEISPPDYETTSIRPTGVSSPATDAPTADATLTTSALRPSTDAPTATATSSARPATTRPTIAFTTATADTGPARDIAETQTISPTPATTRETSSTKSISPITASPAKTSLTNTISPTTATIGEPSPTKTISPTTATIGEPSPTKTISPTITTVPISTTRASRPATTSAGSPTVASTIDPSKAPAITMTTESSPATESPEVTPTRVTAGTTMSPEAAHSTTVKSTDSTSIGDILEPCAEEFFHCTDSSGDTDLCMEDFGRCSVVMLTDEGVSGGVVPPELASAVADGEEDEDLPTSLLECIVSHMECVESGLFDCNAIFQECSLAALQESAAKRRRLEGGGGESPPTSPMDKHPATIESFDNGSGGSGGDTEIPASTGGKGGGGGEGESVDNVGPGKTKTTQSPSDVENMILETESPKFPATGSPNAQSGEFTTRRPNYDPGTFDAVEGEGAISGEATTEGISLSTTSQSTTMSDSPRQFVPSGSTTTSTTTRRVPTPRPATSQPTTLSATEEDVKTKEPSSAFRPSARPTPSTDMTGDTDMETSSTSAPSTRMIPDTFTTTPKPTETATRPTAKSDTLTTSGTVSATASKTSTEKTGVNGPGNEVDPSDVDDEDEKTIDNEATSQPSRPPLSTTSTDPSTPVAVGEQTIGRDQGVEEVPPKGSDQVPGTLDKGQPESPSRASEKEDADSKEESEMLPGAPSTQPSTTESGILEVISSPTTESADDRNERPLLPDRPGKVEPASEKQRPVSPDRPDRPQTGGEISPEDLPLPGTDGETGDGVPTLSDGAGKPEEENADKNLRPEGRPAAGNGPVDAEVEARPGTSGESSESADEDNRPSPTRMPVQNDAGVTLRPAGDDDIRPSPPEDARTPESPTVALKPRPTGRPSGSNSEVNAKPSSAGRPEASVTGTVDTGPETPVMTDTPSNENLLPGGLPREGPGNVSDQPGEDGSVKSKPAERPESVEGAVGGRPPTSPTASDDSAATESPGPSSRETTLRPRGEVGITSRPPGQPFSSVDTKSPDSRPSERPTSTEKRRPPLPSRPSGTAEPVEEPKPDERPNLIDDGSPRPSGGSMAAGDVRDNQGAPGRDESDFNDFTAVTEGSTTSATTVKVTTEFVSQPQRPTRRPQRPTRRPQRPTGRPERPSTRPDRPTRRPERPTRRPQRPTTSTLPSPSTVQPSRDETRAPIRPDDDGSRSDGRLPPLRPRPEKPAEVEKSQDGDVVSDTSQSPKGRPISSGTSMMDQDDITDDIPGPERPLSPELYQPSGTSVGPAERPGTSSRPMIPGQSLPSGSKNDSEESNEFGKPERPEILAVPGRSDGPVGTSASGKPERPVASGNPEAPFVSGRPESDEPSLSVSVKPERPEASEGPDRPDETKPQRPATSESPENPSAFDRPVRPGQSAPSERPQGHVPSIRPDRPFASDSPDQPGETSGSGRPEKPVSSGMPERPTVSGRPDRPGETSESGRSETPVVSGRPEKPTISGRPDRPGEASTPEKPNRPVTSGRPERPAVSGSLDRPGETSARRKPGGPVTSGRPAGRPAVSGRPDRPGETSAPGSPEKPVTSGRPDRPGVSRRPDGVEDPALTVPGRPENPDTSGRPDRPDGLGPTSASKTPEDSEGLITSSSGEPKRPTSPDTPGSPDQTSTTGTPERPTAPGGAERPGQTLTSGRPSRPTAGGSPEKPGLTSSPSSSDSPGTPERPGQTTASGRPDRPSTSEGTEPAESDISGPTTSERPQRPTASSRPVRPGLPPSGRPDKPAPTGRPQGPRQPVPSEIPGSPEQPLPIDIGKPGRPTTTARSPAAERPSRRPDGRPAPTTQRPTAAQNPTEHQEPATSRPKKTPRPTLRPSEPSARPTTPRPPATRPSQPSRPGRPTKPTRRPVPGRPTRPTRRPVPATEGPTPPKRPKPTRGPFRPTTTERILPTTANAEVGEPRNRLDDETGGVDIGHELTVDTELSAALSHNFSHCIEIYLACLSTGTSQGLCKKAFDKCSIDILLESRIGEAELTEELENAATTGLGGGDRGLASELYDCIREYADCLDGSRKLHCMKIYNDCSISAMARARERKVNRVPGIIARVPRPRPRPPQRGGGGGDRPGAFYRGHDAANIEPPLESRECAELNLPTTYHSFSGRMAKNTADCTWDFFTCTRRYGKWPSNKPCCQARFDDCCMFVMGKKKPMMTTTTSTARPAQDATPPDKDYLPPDPSKPPSPNTPNEEQMTETRPTPPPLTTTTTTVSTPRPYDDNVKLIDCIWMFNGCVRHKRKPDLQCKADFNDCSMVAMGMPPGSGTTTTTTTTTTTRRPINDIDLAIPDFLKPSPPTKRPLRPINDIDLPEQQEILMQGTGSIGTNSGGGNSNGGHSGGSGRPAGSTGGEENQESKGGAGEKNPSGDNSGVAGLFEGSNIHDQLAVNHPEGEDGSNEFLSCLLRVDSCREQGLRLADCPNVRVCIQLEAIEAEEGEEDDQIGSSAVGAGVGAGQGAAADYPPSSDCVWRYYACGRSYSESACRQEFRECSGGQSPDNGICADVAENPQNYLVPHPGDCTKFYSCQSLGVGKGWIAHLMDCPPTTGFDTNLRICNFIRSLPRCRQGDNVLVSAYEDLSGRVYARQMRAHSELDLVEAPLPVVGYLTYNRTASTANDTHQTASTATTTAATSLPLVILLSLAAALIRLP